MTPRAELSFARIRLWLLNIYISDLEAFLAGDVNRFGRMVDGKGGGLGSEFAWRSNVKRLLADDLISNYCAKSLMDSARRAKLIGIEVET